MASGALLTQLVVSRFVDHQPWHRQSVILRYQSVHIDRDVMGHWARKLAWLFAPIGERLLPYVLEAPKVHGDETPVTLLGGEAGGHTAYFWVYLRDGRSSGDMIPPAVAFHFHHRSRRQASSGTPCRLPRLSAGRRPCWLQRLYHDPKIKASRGVTEVGFWAHGRRKFADVLEKTPSPFGGGAHSRSLHRRARDQGSIARRAAPGCPPAADGPTVLA